MMGSLRVASFDRLARHYYWLEALCAGRLLQRSRVTHLETLPAPAKVLIYGEGNGRFLSACCRRFPLAEITVVDASEAMIGRAKQRLIRDGLSSDRVQFIQADALLWSPPEGAYDLIVTHYFLDCFDAATLQRLIPVIARAAKPASHWLLADFQVADHGLRRWRSQAILALLYAFFRYFAGVPARTLVCPDALLSGAGFALHQRRVLDAGLLHSDWWTRGPALCA